MAGQDDPVDLPMGVTRGRAQGGELNRDNLDGDGVLEKKGQKVMNGDQADPLQGIRVAIASNPVAQDPLDQSRIEDRRRRRCVATKMGRQRVGGDRSPQLARQGFAFDRIEGKRIQRSAVICRQQSQAGEYVSHLQPGHSAHRGKRRKVMSTPCRHDLPEDVLPGCERHIIKQERANQRAERGQILVQPDCVIEPAQGAGGGVDAALSAPLAQNIVEGLQDARLAAALRS